MAWVTFGVECLATVGGVLYKLQGREGKGGATRVSVFRF
jgi:hypothetical protein